QRVKPTCTAPRCSPSTTSGGRVIGVVQVIGRTLGTVAGFVLEKSADAHAVPDGQPWPRTPVGARPLLPPRDAQPIVRGGTHHRSPLDGALGSPRPRAIPAGDPSASLGEPCR